MAYCVGLNERLSIPTQTGKRSCPAMVRQHITPSCEVITGGYDNPIILGICHSNSEKCKKEEKSREKFQNKNRFEILKLLKMLKK